VAGYLSPERPGMAFHFGMAKLMHDHVVDEGVGQLDNVRIEDNSGLGRLRSGQCSARYSDCSPWL
jgi:hypothetical protein